MSYNPELDRKLKEQLPSLVKRVQDGEPGANDDFANLILPYICTLISKYKYTIDDEIDSLAGIIVMKLISKIDTIDLEKSVLGFITRSAINQAIDQHRKYKANKVNDSVPYQAFMEYDITQELSGMSTDSEYNAEAILNDHLHKEDADIVAMYYLQNKTLQDIADFTGYKVSTIQQTLDYAERHISKSII